MGNRHDEIARVEREIQSDATSVARGLVAADAVFARDIRDLIEEAGYGVMKREQLDELYAIGADDMQGDPDMPEHRRPRRLAELKLALDVELGSRWG